MARWTRWLTFPAAAAAVLAAVASLAPSRPRQAGQPVARHGKLGPAASLALEAVSVARPPGVPARNEAGAFALLRLRVEPGCDLPGSRIAFLLPEGVSVVQGRRARHKDLIAREAETLTLTVFVPEGAAGSVAARLTAGGLSREIYASLEGERAGAGLEGRLDHDHEGRKVRVFPAGERGR